MSTNTMGRWRLLPWVTFVTALAATAALAGLRERSADIEQARAIESATGHFQGIVDESHDRATATSENYTRVLIGSSIDLPSPLPPERVEARLEALEAVRLPGAVAFFVTPAGGEPVPVGASSERRAPLTNPARNGAGLDATLVSDDTVHVSYTTDEGDTVTVVALVDQLVREQEASDGRPRRGTIVTLIAPEASSESHETPVQSADLLPAASVRLTDSQPVAMFDQDWTIVVATADDFLAIPQSSESLIVGVLGVLLSLVFFALIDALVRRLETELRRRRAEEQARSATERFAAGFTTSPTGSAIIDIDGRVVEANEALVALMGQGRLVGKALSDLVAAPHRQQWMERVLGDGGPADRRAVEVCYEPNPGRTVWVTETTTIVPGTAGDDHILIQLSDITEEHAIRSELQRRALRDGLTGLANRAMLHEGLERVLSQDEKSRAAAAVLFIDLDRFKLINDTMGHRAGDELLCEVASRLRSIARDTDTVARFGGDEFVVLCEQLANTGEASKIAERVKAALAEPIMIEDRPILITVSVGIALCRAADDVDSLLANADLAMYAAKSSGRDQAIEFEEGMRTDLMGQVQLEDELVRALSGEEFELFYQPLISLTDDRLIGFEALIRWNHPTKGLVAPDAFLPMARQLGMMPIIDAWALDTAAKQLMAWTTICPEAVGWTMAVNASAINFADPAFAGRVRDIIADIGIDPRRLTIEITEDAIFSHKKIAVDILEQLRDIGTRIAIDDFGTGYSSLSQLATLEIDVLKIDKSFIAELHGSPTSEIVQAVVDMASALGIPTVAEGVETGDDLRRLKAIGATHAQGYLISRPVPAIEALALADSAFANLTTSSL